MLYDISCQISPQIHVVHYNSKYANLSEAASKPDGLAVLGAFIGVSTVPSIVSKTLSHHLAF